MPLLGTHGVGARPSGGLWVRTPAVSAAAPTITSVSPASAAAGTQLDIYGTNFTQGMTAKVDSASGAALTSVTYVNGTHIYGTLPAHADGAVNLYVSNQNGNYTTSNTPFTYAAGGGGFQTPDILNNASFESGWDGYSDWSGNPANPPSGNVVRDTTQAFAGAYAVKCVLPANAGSDTGAQCIIKTSTPGVDRLWTRKYFYFDAAIDGTLKFDLQFDTGNSVQFAGLYCHAGNLAFNLFPEWAGFTVPHIVIGALAPLVGAWHWVEYDYWRNGDTSNGGDFPSVALWLDGTQITAGSLPSGGSWVNGRACASTRTSSAKFGWHYLRSVLNGSPANTVAGNVWFDRVAISSLGRIGP